MTRDDIIRMTWEAELTDVVQQHNDGIVTFAVPHLPKLLMFADLVAAAEREACAKTVERARLHMDGSLGLTHKTDFIATRVTDFLAAQIRAMGKT